ncbi:hypothetical protein HY950_04225 [Candidatus Gottesmanbacteria bacterium]|nr:hypothetical protein [Candidatus Gottesmanbacteria bacterium]
MNLPYRYSYLLANLLFLIVWLFIFLRLKHLRRPMLVLSLISALFGPISELWYFADYWQPYISLPLPGIGGVEDMLFGFSIGGIGAFFYETLFVKHLCYCKVKKFRREWFLLVFGGIELVSLLILTNLFNINSIFSSSIGMIAAAGIMLLIRPDLIPNAVGSALLVAATMFTIYFLGQTFFPTAHEWMTSIWKLYGTDSGILLFRHVPLTEMIWGLSWGLAWGPMYEFLVGARTLRLKMFTKTRK